jgi:hypothetical protein
MYALKHEDNTYHSAFELIPLGVLSKPPKSAHLVMSTTLPEELRRKLTDTLQGVMQSEYGPRQIPSHGYPPGKVEVMYVVNDSRKSRDLIQGEFFASLKEQGLAPISENVVIIPSSAFTSNAPRGR